MNAFRYVEDLREAGVPDKQAEAHLRILHEIVESNLATKRDIKELEQKMKLKINEVKRDIKELEQKMTIKLGALVVVTIGILAALSNINII